MLAIPPFGANSNNSPLEANNKPPVELVVANLELFKILDTPVSERDEYLEEELAQFPYVNGGLFADETIEIPPFTEEIKELLLTKSVRRF